MAHKDTEVTAHKENELKDILWRLGVWDDLTHDQHVELEAWVAQRGKASYRKGYKVGYMAGSRKYRDPDLPSRSDSIKKQRAWVDKKLAEGGV